MFSKSTSSVLRFVDSDGTMLRRVADVGHPPDRLPRYGGYSPMSYGLHVSISPDGSRFVYTSCEYPTNHHNSRTDRAEYPDYMDDFRNYNYEIAISDIEGSNRIRLTENSDALDHYPVWSPDGRKIAFMWRWHFLNGHGGKVWGNLRTLASDGSGIKQLAFSVIHTPPRWSPDSERIAFVGIYKQSYETLSLITVTNDGLATRELVSGVVGSAPSWSPDGRRLAYLRFHEEGKSIWALHTVGMDGEDDRLVGALPGVEVVSATEIYGFGSINEIAWSPDGSKFLILGRDGGAVISDKGEVLHRFSHSYAAWSPDGQKIAVIWHREAQRGKPGPGEILLYTVAPDGSDRRDLVAIGDDGEPVAANPK